MIAPLPLETLRAACKAALREQIWTEAGRLGIPARTDEQSESGHWDVTVIRDVIDRACALEWNAEQLVARIPDHPSCLFALFRPGHSEDGDRFAIVGSKETDRILSLANRTDAHAVTAPPLGPVLQSLTALAGTAAEQARLGPIPVAEQLSVLPVALTWRDVA